jgi:hypothetical protein
MLKAQILSSEAVAPYNGYDSILEFPNGNNSNENAWLTLQLRVKLNFVDSKNPLPGLTVFQGGIWYARDHNGYLFPLLDWPSHLMARFQSEYAQRAEKTWNWQFMLITPRNYSDLDYQCFARGVTVRPYVLCLFRMSVISRMGALLDTSPAAGPMRAGAPHRTINVVNLSYAAGTMSLAPGVTASATRPATKAISQIDALSFRSNDLNYDDADLFRPAWWQKEQHVLSNTVGHEVGHALGQSHVMGLKGNARYAFGGAKETTAAAYGVGSGDKFDAWNIMGAGDRIYLLNAISWRERIALHTGRPVADWPATGMMNTPTRTLPMGIGAADFAPPGSPRRRTFARFL